ncbi:MAG: hypothetical protein WD749_03450 [Phycisphaerales bacterium]
MATVPGRYCIGCGFDLTGIAPRGAPARCPECGREFDPVDVATYDAWPRRARRARLIRRVAIVLAVLGVAAAFFPRGWAVARLTIRAPGRPAAEVVRTELIAPGWLRGLTGARYPGWTTRGEPASAGGRAFDFSATATRVTPWRRGGGGSLRATADADELAGLLVNGVRADVDNAAALFETVMPGMVSGGSYGVSIDSVRAVGTPIPPQSTILAPKK